MNRRPFNQPAALTSPNTVTRMVSLLAALVVLCMSGGCFSTKEIGDLTLYDGRTVTVYRDETPFNEGQPYYLDDGIHAYLLDTRGVK